MKTIVKNEFQCLDVVVRKLSNVASPQRYSPDIGCSPSCGVSPQPENPPPLEPPLTNLQVDVEDVVVVPDAQSAPNEVGVCPSVRASCDTDDVVIVP